MLQENTTAIILFHFCTICEVQNEDNAITFKTSSDDKLSEIYATTTSSLSVGDTITSAISSNYGSPSCSAVYSNKTTLQHCMLTKKK